MNLLLSIAISASVYKCAVFTDMSAFTVRMSNSPIQAIHEVFNVRNQIIQNVIPGTVVSFIGDSTLSVFDSREDAKRFIVRVIKSSPERLNFGLACGNVYYVNGDVFGYSVNVASKLGEDEAQNGQVLTDLGEITNEMYFNLHQ